VGELRAVRAQDESFDLLAAALPVADPGRAHFALDSPPETPGPLGVSALHRRNRQLGGSEHQASPVSDVPGELQRPERMFLRGIEVAALALEPGGIAGLACLPPFPVHLVDDCGALERELDRERQMVFSVGLLRQVSEYLASPRRRPSRRKVRSDSSSSGQASAVSPMFTMFAATR
jgi:hypothetical protein